MQTGSFLLVCACLTAAHAEVRITKSILGTSRLGTPIEVFTLSGNAPSDADTRPALLIVAGVQPEHRVGIEVARLLTQHDWSQDADLLEENTLYIVPSLNPDGLAWLAGENAPVVEIGTTQSPFDADRDARLNEDPPDDLNGDGLITMMRVFNPPAKYGLVSTLVTESDDPRLARPAKVSDGEIGAFTILTEGIDNDGDGSFNEDGPGGPGSGVNLNDNFPTHFPEFKDGAGPMPLSEPESRSLVQWMQGHRNIVSVLVLGTGDSFLNKPPTGKFDESGGIPKGLEKDDEPYQQYLAKSYKQAVSMDSAPPPDDDGSLLSWAYADFGAWAYESAVWSRPKSASKDEAKTDDAKEAEPQESAPPSVGPADERAALIESGVPEQVAIFLTATPAERQAIAAEFESKTEAERAEVMQQVGSLSPELQARMMAAIQQTAGGQPGDEPATVQSDANPVNMKPNDSDDGKWLTYSDKQREGSGFVEWTPFDHPQLGRVEIGGFVPGFKLNPPAGETEALAAEQVAVARMLLKALPRVEVREPLVERLGRRVWRVSVELCNPGYLPTSSAVGLKIRQPIAVHLGVDPKQVAVGRRVVVLNRLLGSNDCQRVEWVISGEPGQTIDIDVRSDRFGHQRVQATLEGDQP